MNNGILLALLAYATYAWSDAAIKALGGSMSIFEIGFYQMAIAGALILMTRPDGHGWLDFWRMRHPIPVQARAVIGAVAAIVSVFAFTSIPLAEVYAIVFLSPLFVTLLSAIFLKEHVGPWRWFAVALGFAGVLLVVRPGFRALELGHLAALSMSLMSATSVILTRSLVQKERLTTIVGYLLLYSITFNAVAMGATSARLPGWPDAALLLVAGACAACGHLLLLRAARFTQANRIAPTHYSQIAWAVLLGALFFNERPDIWSILGIMVIAGAGLLTTIRERIRLGAPRWNPFGRPRL